MNRAFNTKMASNEKTLNKKNFEVYSKNKIENQYG